MVPCLSSGFAKINKIISIFVLFSRFFWPFRKFGFFLENGGGGGGGGQISYKSSQMGCMWSIFKSTKIKPIVFLEKALPF